MRLLFLHADAKCEGHRQQTRESSITGCATGLLKGASALSGAMLVRSANFEGRQECGKSLAGVSGGKSMSAGGFKAPLREGKTAHLEKDLGKRGNQSNHACKTQC